MEDRREKWKKIGKYATAALLLVFLVHVATHFSYYKAVFDYWFKTERTLIEVRFLYALDGDTIVVKNSEGKEMRVRLLGIDTPESTNCDENACSAEGEEAAEFLRNCLEKNETVYLEYDEQDHDKYGRELAYVWLTDNVDLSSFEDFEKHCLNAVILKSTHCKTLPMRPNERYKDWFEQIEDNKKKA